MVVQKGLRDLGKAWEWVFRCNLVNVSLRWVLGKIDGSLREDSKADDGM